MVGKVAVEMTLYNSVIFVSETKWIALVCHVGWAADCGILCLGG
jgi:hypothetical protein